MAYSATPLHVLPADPTENERVRARHQVDQEIGRRIRARRVVLGMTQEALAARVGVTFQQIQKYESAANRIGASRLQEVSVILGVPLTFFFDAKPDVLARPTAAVVRGGVGVPQTEVGTPAEREVMDLVRAFGTISNPRTRRAIITLAQTVGDTGATIEPMKPRA